MKEVYPSCIHPEFGCCVCKVASETHSIDVHFCSMQRRGSTLPALQCLGHIHHVTCYLKSLIKSECSMQSGQLNETIIKYW